jgi:hypothetical protein
MDEVRRELSALRGRIRLQSLAAVAVLVVSAFALGGADAIAGHAAAMFVETASFKVRTKKADASLVDRITIGTDSDVVTFALCASTNSGANLVLATSGPAAATSTAIASTGSIMYDSTSNTLKYRNAVPAWVEVGTAATAVVRKTANETVSWSASLQNDDHLTFNIGANETWVVTYHIIATTQSASATPDFKFGFAVPSGATTSAYGIVAPLSSNPSSSLITSTSTCGLAGDGTFQLVVPIAEEWDEIRSELM